MPTATMLAACLLQLASSAFAHMQLTYPPPFNASNNPHRTTEADPYLQFPYDCCGPHARWTYPCRGYTSLLGTPDGAPTATWEVNSTQTWNMSGVGNHYGGSCQVGFSLDDGHTFRVVTSYEGNCPHRNNGDGPDGQNFEFTVPADINTGVQIFAWAWYNREQEFNMNCAAVSIVNPSDNGKNAMNSISAVLPSSSMISSASSSKVTISLSTTPCTSLDTLATTVIPLPTIPTRYQTANNCTCTCETPVNISSCICACPASSSNFSTSLSSSRKDDLPRRYDDSAPRHDRSHRRQTSSTVNNTSPAAAFASRPLMFVANNGNGCKTPRTTAELKFPDPGPDVVVGDNVYPLALPVGACSEEAMLVKQAYTFQ